MATIDTRVYESPDATTHFVAIFVEWLMDDAADRMASSSNSDQDGHPFQSTLGKFPCSVQRIDPDHQLEKQIECNLVNMICFLSWSYRHLFPGVHEIRWDMSLAARHWNENRSAH